MYASDCRARTHTPHTHKPHTAVWSACQTLTITVILRKPAACVCVCTMWARWLVVHAQTHKSLIVNITAEVKPHCMCVYSRFPIISEPAALMVKQRTTKNSKIWLQNEVAVPLLTCFKSSDSNDRHPWCKSSEYEVISCVVFSSSPPFTYLLNDWSRMSSEGGCSSPWPSEDTLQATVNGWRPEEWMICSCKFSPRVCLHWLLKWAECQTNEVKPNGAQKVKQKLTGSTTTGTTRPDVTVVYCFVHFNYTKLRLRNI